LATIFGYSLFRAPNSNSQKHNPKILASISYLIENYHRIVDIDEVSSLVDKLVSQNVKLDNEESLSYVDGLLMKISNLELKLKTGDNKTFTKNSFTIEELVDLLSKLKSANSIFK